MIEYKNGTECINWDSLFELYYETDGVRGWGLAREHNLIKESFLQTHRVVTAWNEDRIVGAARLVSDGISYGWIHDVAVHPEYRKRNIGRELITRLMADKDKMLFGLTSSFEAVDFYKSLGFKKHKTGMAKYPGESMYLED